MNKKISAALAAVLIILGAAAFAAWPRAGKIFLWRLTSPEGATAYLAGSIHLASPDLYPLPEPFSRAFGESGRLVVELDPEALPAETLAAFIDERGLAGPGRSLRGLLTPAAREALDQSGLGRPEYDRYRPWLAALIIEVEALERHGFSDAHGLDKHFLDRAAAGGLPVLELETFDQQMTPLADMNEAEADLFFRIALKEAADLPALVSGFWAAWKNGDAPGFAEIFFRDYRQYPELSGLMDKMINQRNRAMLEKLLPILSAPGRPNFVVVGAGHLVGEEGLLALLAARDFKIEQVKKP